MNLFQKIYLVFVLIKLKIRNKNEVHGGVTLYIDQKQTEKYRSRIKRARKIFLKSIHPSPFVTENFNKTKSGVLIREWKEKSFDRWGKEEAQAVYEREEYKNDVRYQDRTEITLGYE